MVRESPSKTVVPSGHRKDRAEQVTEALGVMGLAMMILAVASAVDRGFVCEHHAVTKPKEGCGVFRREDGSCTEVASTRGHGWQKSQLQRDGLTANAVPRDDREPQMRNVRLYRRQQDFETLPLIPG
jgi:hypothetical protein